MKWSTLSQSERWLLRISGALTLAAALVWGRIALATQVNPKAPASGVASQNRFAAKIALRRDESLQLREKMRFWAEKHQDAIRKMRGGNEIAFQTVYRAIPVHPDADVIGISGEDTRKFSWETHAGDIYDEARREVKMNALSDERLRASMTLEQAMREYHWQNSRDIVVVRSISPRINYSLWASGRITETAFPRDCEGIIDCSKKEQHKEIVPPYDFVIQE